MNPVANDNVRVAIPVASALGEGLHWDAAAQCLWMVDIHGCRLIRWDLQSSSWREWATPQRVGWVIPEKDTGALIIGLQEGFARARLGDRDVSIEWLAKPFTAKPWMRLNDAKADATGAIWAGSMNNDNETSPEGCLFRLGADGRLDVVDTGYSVANGPAIRADGRLMLHTDSARRTIYAFDLDVARGTISNKRVWKQFAPEDGYPDGMTFDAEGGVWVAHWGAGCISRFSADGRLLRRVRLPASNVTNICFAGAGLSRLFVSSARIGLTPGQSRFESAAGAVFEVAEHSAVGLPSNPARQCG